MLAVLLLGLYVASKSSGILDETTPEGIRKVIDQWGYSGVLLYFLLFAVGQLFFLPGLLFVFAAVLAYGGGLGFLYAMIGGILSASFSFFIVRYIGGNALKGNRYWFVNRMLLTLKDRPLISIFALRAIFTTAPWLNYALALSDVKFQHYVIGTASGFIPQFLLITLFGEWLMLKWF